MKNDRSCIYYDKECGNFIALPVYGRFPSAGVCRNCEFRTGPRGLGDYVQWYIGKLVLKPWSKLRKKPIHKPSTCGGCASRRDALNRLVPFSKNPKAE